MNPPIRRGAFFASQNITANANSTTVINRNHKGIIVDIDVTAITDTPSVVPNIQSEDPAGTWTTLLAGAAITATGHVRLVIYPGAVAVANSVLNQPLPNKIRLQMDGTWSGTDAITFTANYQLVP